MDASSNIKVMLLLILTTAVLAEIVSNISAEDSQENLRKLARANNNLALNLHRRLVAGATNKNVFFSPFSISVALAMLFYGARGDTAKELRETLGYDAAELSDELVHSTFNQFLKTVLSRSASSGYTLRAANAILVDKSLDLNPDYKNGTEYIYRARIRDVNFKKDASKIKRRINKWVKTKTQGKIDSLVEEVSPNTILMILNAVYFRGLWKTPFDANDTELETFYNNGEESQAKQIDMMYLQARFPFTEALDSRIIELPYKGDDISMVVLLPNERNGLPVLENDLTLESLASIRQHLRMSHTVFRVQLPKFKLEYSKNLVGDLTALNMSRIFSPGADFSGMIQHGEMLVSDIIHKAAIETNEEGSTAAAVTSIFMARSGLMFSEDFIVDHPFLFAIVNRRNNLILFMGRINTL